MRLFHLPHGVPVLDTVAAHLLGETDGDPAALSRALVFLPTRRAARALGASFLRVGEGRPLLLPRLVAIGDIDSNPLFEADATGLPPAIAPLERAAHLAGMIRDDAPDILPDRALKLALELAALLDEADEADADISGLQAMAPERFARHWQATMRFLGIATTRWRAVLQARGLCDPVARRSALLHRLATRLAHAPPADAVLTVGIASAAPSTVALLRAIALLPRGAVILPGLDTSLPEAAWRALGASHPQHEYRMLLDRLDIAPGAVAAFPHAEPPHAARRLLLSRALRPAEALDWQAPPTAPQLQGLALLTAPDSATEARAIALAVRHALEAKEARIAVITPDRALAERVCAALARFGIRVADSAAMPLGRTPPGALLRLLADAVARRLAPVPLLALIRHPLVSCGLGPQDFRAAGRNFELAALRGPRPAPGEVLKASVLSARWRDNEGIKRLQRALSDTLGPLLQLVEERQVAPERLLRTTVAVAEALCATDSTKGALRLWNGPEGGALARHLAACAEALAALSPVAPRWWPDLLDQLLAQDAVRTRRLLQDESHPRVEILGVLEARLLDHDVHILAGLNEGTWPALPDPGPWLSREQRATLGLASPDAHVGFAAADLVAAACAAPRVILTRAVRQEGEPAVASRWITRLVALAGGDALRPEIDVVALAGLLDRDAPVRDEKRPEPRPPLAVRPRSLPVTAIDTLRRNPYAIYAQRILQLRPLDPLDQEADAADWGSLVHAVAADFFTALAHDPAPDPEAAFLRHAARRMTEYNTRPGLVALWTPRLATLAPWFARLVEARATSRFFCEVEGQATIPAPSDGAASGAFVLTARADLIERTSDGQLAIADFKTGAAPSGAMVRDGRALQLPLSGLIAARGGFRGVPAAPVARLVYAKLPGGSEPGTEQVVASEAQVAQALAQAEAILLGLIAHYGDPAHGYPGVPVEDDFAHLARWQGWGVVGEEEAGE